MVKIIILRHGHSLSNMQNTFTGHQESPLSEIGLEQAKRACDYIFKNYKIDKIYSSDLSRAVNTILPLSKKLNKEITTSSELRELYGGEWEGVKFQDLKTLFPKDYGLWETSVGLARPTGGESYKEAQTRAVNFITKIAKENDNKTIIIATHGGLIRAIECYFKKIPLENMQSVSYVSNASISIYNYNNGEYEVVKTNVNDYLEGLTTQMPNSFK